MPKKEKEIYNQLIAEGKCPDKIVYKEGIGYIREPVCSIKDIEERLRLSQDRDKTEDITTPQNEDVANTWPKMLKDLKLPPEIDTEE